MVKTFGLLRITYKAGQLVNVTLQNKTYQSVSFSDLSVLVYPKKAEDNREIAVVRLQQNYTSNNFKSDMYKRLYLTKKDNDWKILYEGR